MPPTTDKSLSRTGRGIHRPGAEQLGGRGVPRWAVVKREDRNVPATFICLDTTVGYPWQELAYSSEWRTAVFLAHLRPATGSVVVPFPRQLQRDACCHLFIDVATAAARAYRGWRRHRSSTTYPRLLGGEQVPERLQLQVCCQPVCCQCMNQAPVAVCDARQCASDAGLPQLGSSGPGPAATHSLTVAICVVFCLPCLLSLSRRSPHFTSLVSRDGTSCLHNCPGGVGACPTSYSCNADGTACYKDSTRRSNSLSSFWWCYLVLVFTCIAIRSCVRCRVFLAWA